jgi:hypothetical protein
MYINLTRNSSFHNSNHSRSTAVTSLIVASPLGVITSSGVLKKYSKGILWHHQITVLHILLSYCLCKLIVLFICFTSMVYSSSTCQYHIIYISLNWMKFNQNKHHMQQKQWGTCMYKPIFSCSQAITSLTPNFLQHILSTVQKKLEIFPAKDRCTLNIRTKGLCSKHRILLYLLGISDV